MKTRTLLIATALIIPPVALAIIIQSGPIGQKNNLTLATAVPKGAISNEPVQLPPIDPATAEAARLQKAEEELLQKRARIALRLETLKKMTPDQWPAERTRNPHVPTTLDEALARNAAILNQLETITPQEWAAGKRPQAPSSYTPSSGQPQ